MKLYQAIAHQIGRLASDNLDIHNDADEKLGELESLLPSGSGIDAGVEITRKSTTNKIIFRADFHHMDEHGSYDGWTYHEVIITPSFTDDFNIRITGQNRNGIKELLSDTFVHCLTREYDARTHTLP